MKTVYADAKVDAKFAGNSLDVVSDHGDYMLCSYRNHSSDRSIVRIEAVGGVLRWVEFRPPADPKECKSCGYRA